MIEFIKVLVLSLYILVLPGWVWFPLFFHEETDLIETGIWIPVLSLCLVTIVGYTANAWFGIALNQMNSILLVAGIGLIGGLLRWVQRESKAKST